MWSARRGNTALLEAFEPLFLSSDTTLLPQILEACVVHPCFISLYNKWCEYLTDIQRFELVFGALKQKNDTHANFLLDILPALTVSQQQEILNRSAVGTWSVFDRVAQQLIAPQPLLGTVALLVEHNQLERLQRILPFVAWSSAHYYDISLAYFQSAEAYDMIRPFITKVVATNDVMLRTAAQKDLSTFKKVLHEVSDCGVHSTILCELLRFKQDDGIQALLEHTGYLTLSEHLCQHTNISHEMRVYFEEKHNSLQRSKLMEATHDQTSSDRVRRCKL